MTGEQRLVGELNPTAFDIAGGVFGEEFDDFAMDNPGAFRGRTIDLKPDTPNQYVLFFTETANAITAEYVVLGHGFSEPQYAIQFKKKSAEIRVWSPQDVPYRDSSFLFALGKIEGKEANHELISKWMYLIGKALGRQGD